MQVGKCNKPPMIDVFGTKFWSNLIVGETDKWGKKKGFEVCVCVWEIPFYGFVFFSIYATKCSLIITAIVSDSKATIDSSSSSGKNNSKA